MEEKHKQIKPFENPFGVDKVQELHEIKEDHLLIVEEWFNNFFNKSKAVMSVKKDIKNHSQAVQMFNRLSQRPEVKKYIRDKREEMQDSTGITALGILKERLNWISVDATDLLGLNEQEIKKLPAETRRAIQSVKVNEREETDRKGNHIKTTTYDFKLIDKNDSLKEISKLIGAYEIHNKQKSTLNANNVNPEDRTKLIEIIKQLASNKTKTINI